jgi:hypothetical protein
VTGLHHVTDGDNDWPDSVDRVNIDARESRFAGQERADARPKLIDLLNKEPGDLDCRVGDGARHCCGR